MQARSHQSLPDSPQRMILESKYGERDTFLILFNPDVQYKICDSDDRCFFGDFPTLATIKAGYGQNAPKMWLLPQLYNLSEYCGCHSKLQGKPLEECAHIIAKEFWYLKISEIMLFMYRFKAGCYGRFYGSVDPLIIVESLRKFCEERRYAYDRHEAQIREQREKEECKNAITYEEYLRRKEARQ